MDEITRTRYALWASDVKSCRESKLTVRDWCHEKGIPVSTYYNRLKRLRKAAIQYAELSCQPVAQVEFEKVPQDAVEVQDPPGTALRIQRGDMVIEVSNDASASILSLLQGVLSC